MPYRRALACALVAVAVPLIAVPTASALSLPLPLPTTSSPSSQSAAVPPGATWFSTFEDGNPWSKWEGYGQPLQVMQGGAQADQIQVVSSASQGIPAPPGYGVDTNVLLTQVSSAQYHQWADNYPRSYCCSEAKLYHGWGAKIGPGDSPAMQPGTESGSYRAWYYIPADTPTVSSASWGNPGYWAMLMEWKDVPDPSNPAKQTPVGGAALLPVDGKVWICLGRGWPSCYPPSAANAVPAPLGRWFELRADLVHGVGVDWFIDGQKVWTSRDITGLQGGGWIFGVGHYGGIGKYYAKNASFTPF